MFSDINALMNDLVERTQGTWPRWIGDGAYEFAVSIQIDDYDRKRDGDIVSISRYVDIEARIFPNGEFELRGKARYGDHESQTVQRDSCSTSSLSGH